MAKDPAVLWYFGDWAGGTATMTRHLKGCYIDLLSAQFHSGPLSLDEIKTVLGADFGSSWPTLQKKFEKDENGSFYNVRLKAEKDRRIKYTESRKAGAHAMHMHKQIGMHMENRNRNENKDKNIKECEDCSGKGFTPQGFPCNHRRFVSHETVEK